jgi:ABC-type transporter Mla subunit MlaD
VTKPRSAPVPPLLVPMVQGIDVSPLLAVLIPYLERLEEAVSQITTEVKKLSGKLDAAAERAKKTAADLRDQIAELKAKVEAAGNDPETLDLIDKMTKTADAIDPEVPATLPPDDAPPEPAPAG